MSNVKRILELRPPGHEQAKERLTSPGHVCGYCHGMGYFGGSLFRRDEEPKSCPVCGGLGHVDAVITIEWKPSKKE